MHPEPVCSKSCLKPKPVRPLGTRPRTQIQSQKQAVQGANAQGVGHGSDTHLSLPPTFITILFPQPGRQRKSISPHPHPSSLPPPSRWQPSSRTRASKSTFRAVGACLIIAENQRKPGEERRKDRGRWTNTEEGQMEGGREGGGKETEQRERRRRQEISASNPNNAASASQTGSFPAGKWLQLRCRSPHRCAVGTARLRQAPERYPA